MSWQQKIITAVNMRKKTNTLRVRKVVENGAKPFLFYKKRRYLNFSSNDYLGLSQHPAIIRAWQDGLKNFGTGSGGSSYINGYTVAHKELEEILARWLDYPRALLFVSGFVANQAIIIALANKKDHIIADRLSHASILEAAKLSQAQLHRFAHNNILNLEILLNKACNGHKLVITEGIFSMDGDSAPLSNIYEIVKKKDAWLMVDDAHGFGVTGYNGKGSCNMQGIKPELLVVTFGKSIGISGAAVLCSEDLAQYLLQFSKHLIYSTSMPPSQAMAIKAAIELIRSDDGNYRRNKLKQYIHIFREGMSKFKGQLAKSYSAIQPLIVGDDVRALHLASRLRDAGIWTIAIRPPTVPKGTSRLRLTLTAAHELQDINTLLEVFHEIYK